MAVSPKIQGCCAQNYSRMRWGGGRHYSTEYHKKCTCVILNWINFTNNDCIVDFLTSIYGQMTGQSDPDKCTDIWQNSLIYNHVEIYTEYKEKYISVLEEVMVLKQPRLIFLESTKLFT